jgi:hypothetical protein
VGLRAVLNTEATGKVLYASVFSTESQKSGAAFFLGNQGLVLCHTRYSHVYCDLNIYIIHVLEVQGKFK